MFNQRLRNSTLGRRLVAPFFAAAAIVVAALIVPLAAGAFTMPTSGLTTPVYCGGSGQQIVAQMPAVAAPTGARWEYWYPRLFSNVTSDGNGHASGGSVYALGPAFARDLATGHEYYLTPSGAWSAAYKSGISAIWSKPVGAVPYAVDDWIEFSNSALLWNNRTDEGFRGGSAYYGPAAPFLGAECL